MAKWAGVTPAAIVIVFVVGLVVIPTIFNVSVATVAFTVPPAPEILPKPIVGPITVALGCFGTHKQMRHNRGII